MTGYLGSAVCLTLLKDGSYKVRGTVRSTSNEQKLAPLKVAAVPRIVCAMSCADTTSVPLPGGLRGPVFAAGAG